jgi:hypothetical protein
MKKRYHLIIAPLIILLSLASTSLFSVDDPFEPCSPEIVQIIYQTLLDVHDFFYQNNIPYWIDSGTLLGAVRNGGLIKWDDDLDLCIFEEHEKELLKLFPILKLAGYEMIGMPFGYKIYPANGLDIPSGRPWKHPGCDIFIMTTDGSKAFYKLRCSKERGAENLEINLSDILPLRTYFFGPLAVMGPRNPLPYLKDWYGENCMTTAYINFIHATETSIKPTTKLLIDKDDFKSALPAKALKHNIKPYTVEQWPVDFLDRYPKIFSS